MICRKLFLDAGCFFEILNGLNKIFVYYHSAFMLLFFLIFLGFGFNDFLSECNKCIFLLIPTTVLVYP